MQLAQGAQGQPVFRCWPTVTHTWRWVWYVCVCIYIYIITYIHAYVYMHHFPYLRDVCIKTCQLSAHQNGDLTTVMIWPSNYISSIKHANLGFSVTHMQDSTAARHAFLVKLTANQERDRSSKGPTPSVPQLMEIVTSSLVPCSPIMLHGVVMSRWSAHCVHIAFEICEHQCLYPGLIHANYAARDCRIRMR